MAALRSDAIPRVVIMRNDMLRKVPELEVPMIWIEENGAERWKRRHWDALGLSSIVVLETDADICRARVARTPAYVARPGAVRAPDEWWAAYTVDYTDRRIAS